MKQPPYKDQIFIHRKTGRRVKVLNEPETRIGYNLNGYIELLYLDQNGPIRHGRKLAALFDYDYIKESDETNR